MKIKKALCLLAVAALSLQAHAGVTYRPGFIQAKFFSNSNFDSAIVTDATADWTPGAVMSEVAANESNCGSLANSYSNALSGKVWSWEKGNSTFGYAGEVYLDAGEKITFGKYLDDGARIMVNGTVIMNHSTWNNFATASYQNSGAAGWYPIDIRIWDGTGGKGPTGGSWPGMGLGYNMTNYVTFTKAGWSSLGQISDLSRFRAAVNGVVGSVAYIERVGDNYVFTLNCPSAASATVYIGATDGGNDPSAWALSGAGSSAAPGEFTVEVPYSGSAKHFNVCITGNDGYPFISWLGTASLSMNPAGSVKLVGLTKTTADIDCTLTAVGVGATNATATLEIAADSGFNSVVLSQAFSGTATSAPHTFSIKNAGPLSMGAAYYARARLVNSAGAQAYTAAIPFSTQSENSMIDHTTVGTALYLRVGESMELSPVAGAGYYTIRNPRPVAFQKSGDSWAGARLVGVEPGVTLVNEYDTDGDFLAAGVVIVLPNSNADCYVADIKNNSPFVWETSANWIKVGSDTNDTYPKNAGDFAYIPYFSVYPEIVVGSEITVSQIHFAWLDNGTNNASFTARLRGNNSAGVVNLQSMDNGPAKIAFWSSQVASTGDGRVQFCLSGSNAGQRLQINAVTDADIDLGGPKGRDCQASNANAVRLYLDSHGGLNIPEGKTVRIVHSTAHPNWGDDQDGTGIAFACGNTYKITGSGTNVWALAAPATVANRVFADFSGTVVSRAFGDPRNDAHGSRNGLFHSRLEDASNATLVVEGYIGPTFSQANCVGAFSQGNRHGYGEPNSYLTNTMFQAGAVARGGILQFIGEKKDWSAMGGIRTNKTARLTVSDGLSFIATGSTTSNALNYVEFSTLEHENSGTLYVSDVSVYKNDATSYYSRQNYPTFLSHAVGNTSSTSGTDVYPIVPWMVMMYSEGNHKSIGFAHTDPASGNLAYITRNSIRIDEVDNPLRNLYSNDKETAISQDRTVNSLVIANHNKGKTLGERTLTITSGGLILLQDGTSIGSPSGGLSNGALSFPNTAYVYATSTTRSNPNQIWASIDSPNGFVAGFTGYLLLGGNQTGIDESIIVNNGTLMLGAMNGSGALSIDVPIHIVGGNSKVALCTAGSLSGQALYFNDVAGFGGTFETLEGVSERAYELWIDDVNYPKGTYGATGSGAEFVDDIHFSGNGVIRVTHDRCLSPTMILIY